MDKRSVVVWYGETEIYTGKVDRWGTNETGQIWIERDNQDGSMDFQLFPRDHRIQVLTPAHLVRKPEVL